MDDLSIANIVTGLAARLRPGTARRLGLRRRYRPGGIIEVNCKLSDAEMTELCDKYNADLEKADGRMRLLSTVVRRGPLLHVPDDWKGGFVFGPDEVYHQFRIEQTARRWWQRRNR